MKTTVAVEQLLQFLLEKTTREGFIEQVLEKIEGTVGQLIESDRRNLQQWKSHKGPGIIAKTPKLRRRKKNMEKMQKLLNDVSRSMRKLAAEVRKPETDPER